MLDICIAFELAGRREHRRGGCQNHLRVRGACGDSPNLREPEIIHLSGARADCTDNETPQANCRVQAAEVIAAEIDVSVNLRLYPVGHPEIGQSKDNMKHGLKRDPLAF